VTRKLTALCAALAAAILLLAFELRREWRAARQRQQSVTGYRLKPSPALPLVPMPKLEPVQAAAYAAVAEKNLFSRDRNPNVILDPVAPPPQKAVPPFPVARGVMLWDGVPPTVVLSERAGGVQHGYHPGDSIGEWKIVAVDNQYLSLEWDGKRFKKRLDELLDKTSLSGPDAPAAPAPSPAAAAPAPPPPAPPQNSSGPGADVGGGFKACVPGDSTPAGTVLNGMKKVVSATPFGSGCQWEPVK
jgi:hypothetical protein